MAAGPEGDPPHATALASSAVTRSDRRVRLKPDTPYLSRRTSCPALAGRADALRERNNLEVRGAGRARDHDRVLIVQLVHLLDAGQRRHLLEWHAAGLGGDGRGDR